MTANLFDVSGRKAIVAGGTGDLGRAMVTGLREAGVEVVVLGRVDGGWMGH
jgi:NAD(P)-dependent dehydrogenase (short-subunit alcohol dehydrogenase family)